MDELREACAAVAIRASHVRIEHRAIPDYADSLRARRDGEAAATGPPAGRSREALSAFWLTLDAINFGSGWFPTLRKRPGLSGYNTIATAVRERVDATGPWTAAQLARMDTAVLAPILGQDPHHELMSLYAASLRDLGRHVGDEYRGEFTAVVDASAGSAVKLALSLGRWRCFEDRSRYQELELPFLKRAQIAAADLHRAGVTRFGDLDRLTMFADNLVPHVLRLDGILGFDPGLEARIERHELIEHGSPQEVEIRACAVQAVELLVGAGAAPTAAELDQLLWERGQQPSYKARPRHRTRCTAY